MKFMCGTVKAYVWHCTEVSEGSEIVKYLDKIYFTSGFISPHKVTRSIKKYLEIKKLTPLVENIENITGQYMELVKSRYNGNFV